LGVGLVANRSSPWNPVCYEVLRRASDLDGLFRTTHKTGNQHEIWNLEGRESLQVTYTENNNKIISK
jgi:hypothetical protein